MNHLFRFLATLVLIVGALYLLTRHMAPEVPLTEYVPADSLAVLEWQDPAGALRRFRATRVGRCLETIKWPDVMRGLGMPRERIDAIQRRLARAGDLVDGPLFAELFGGRVVVALLAHGRDRVGEAGDPLQDMVLLARPRHDALAGGMVRFMLEQKGQTVRVGAYQGTEIYCLRTDLFPAPLYLAAHDDLLLVSPDQGPLRRCLDLVLARLVRQETGMAGNRAYGRLKKRARGQDDVFCYLDVAAIKSMLTHHGAASVPDVAGPVVLAPTARGVQRAVFFHQPFNDVHQFASIVEFDTSRLAPFQAAIYSRPPVENCKIARMPARLLVYFWTNWLDLPDWWHSTLRRSRGREREMARRFAAWVERITGRDMDRALAMFGQRFGFSVVEVITSGFFPVPRICLCVEMAEPGAIRAILARLLRNVPVHREMIGGVPVVSIMAAGGLMQPSYAMVGRYLVLSDGRDQIKAILRPSGDLLVDDPDFRKVDTGFLRANNMVAFVRSADLVDDMKELVSWLGTMVAIRDEEAATASKVLVDKVALPLLESMKMFRTMGIRSYTGQGELVLRSTVLVEDSVF